MMRRYAKIYLGLLFGLSMVLTTGCLHSRSATETDGRNAEADGDRAQRDTQRQSGYIAAAAGEESGWADTVSAEEAKGRTAWRAEELLVGQIAGVQVHQHPRGGISVRMRGPNSFLAGNEPLYIVDGMPLLAGGVLTGINPFDIERIEVLKDVDAKAIYGARGANGVVLITTKHGK